MAQQFIVEGNDGYVLSALCERNGFGLPFGYTKRSYRDFVVNAGGIDKISFAVLDALNNEDVTNIGVVVDANDVGLLSRIDSVTSTIKKVYPSAPVPVDMSPQGWTAEIKPGLTFGLWVMPNNDSPGYLEHFLVELIKSDDPNLGLANKFLTEAKKTGQHSFVQARDQKALIALFLALQEEPGMNAQTAIKKGLLDHQHPLAQRFLSWFGHTFRLGQT